MSATCFPRSEDWPNDASAFAATYAELIVEALNHPALLVSNGWSEPLDDSPVWLCWHAELNRGQGRPRLGCAFLAGLYGLAARGNVQLREHAEHGAVVVLGGEAERASDFGRIENEILDHLDKQTSHPIAALLAELARSAGGKRPCLPASRPDGVDGVVSGLRLAELFVRLECGVGLPEPDKERLELLLERIEVETHRSLSELSEKRRWWSSRW